MTTTLPIRRIILYKHGVGYFERRGNISGEQVRLSFPRPAMDDMLKSLVALDMGAGQVLSIDFETPEDRAALLAKGSIHLSDDRSLLDLLRDLRGRKVRCVADAQHGGEIEGLVVGVDYEQAEPLLRAMVSLYQPEQHQVRTLPVSGIQHLLLLDDKATADLNYFLRATQSEEEHRSATLHLSAGEHDLLVGYIAPAPAWRVSYRMLFEPENQPPAQAEADRTGVAGSLLLQGWGLFDNQLEEDLEGVHLTLVAGMPVSFRYRLYEPHTPQRPLVQDEERTVGAPIFYEGAPPLPPAAPAPQAAGGVFRSALAEAASDEMAAPAQKAFAAADMLLSAADMEEAVQVSTSGSERGALFAYEVGHPVSVGRGQSAMVPILSRRIACRRDLLYNGQKLPKHPVASLRLHNETGLTLERGPVTVLEEGSYAGEAVVPFTHADAEMIVPFAVELGINVEEKHDNERRTAAIAVRNDYLLIHEYDLHHHTYHLTSTLSQPVDVTIEHRCFDGYELTDTPPPVERSASFARWPVACAAGSRTVFLVHERRMVSRHEQVRSLTGKQLQSYLKNKFLDEQTVKALEEVLQLYHQVAETQQQVKLVEREREAIYKQQRQIQGNLGPLGREGDEGQLRARYVTELNRLEDRLKNLESEEQRLQQRIVELERQAQARLNTLQAK